MQKGQKSVRAGVEDFLCPFTDMYITQGSNSAFSHKGIMANDVRGVQPGVRYPYYAPCTCKCYATYPSSGQAMWQSVNKVRFANGRIDFATFCTVHDDSFDAKPGLVLSQGAQMGNMGMRGNATGVHCHIEISQSADRSWYKNKYGIYHFNNEYDTDDCYFVDNTNIIQGMGGNWRLTSAVPVLPPVTGNVAKDIYKNQIEVKVNNLRVRTSPGLKADVLGHAGVGYFNYYETRDADGYTWFRIADGQWIASNNEWTTVYPATSRDKFINLPPDKIDERAIYDVNTKKKLDKTLKVKKFGGLTYKILAFVDNKYYAEIQTNDYGKVLVRITDATPVTDKPMFEHGYY